jgi:AcrR family transcriptional regulator
VPSSRFPRATHRAQGPAWSLTRAGPTFGTGLFVGMQVSPTASQARPSARRLVRTRSGANASAHSQVTKIQRARILAGMFDVIGEREVRDLSVAHVVRRSGVSRRTFYEIFADLEDCLLAAFGDVVAYASERVLPAYRAASGWREQIRAGLIALLELLDSEPVTGRFLIVESVAGGARVRECRRQVLADIVVAVDAGREQGKPVDIQLPLTGEGVVGGALSVLQARMAEPERKPLLELASPLMSMIVMPYLGTTAARRELLRPVIQSRKSTRASNPLSSDPFKETGIRLTYRTVRVLMAIADTPRASNRTVGNCAGITDQGQISKLLSRLQRMGLVSNTGLRSGQGAPNAWSLTVKGQQVAHSIDAHTEGFQSDVKEGMGR